MPSILLVDNTALCRSSTKTFLELILGKEGLIINEASDGTEAVDYIQRGQSPDLILMDLSMPRMIGTKAAQEIRSLGYNGPIIIHSLDQPSIDHLRKYGDKTIEYLVKGDIETLEKSVITKLRPAA